jgi:hypothetical protein
MPMTIRERHPALFDFLAAWFAEADLEGRGDAEVIAAYRAVPDAPARAAVVAQGRALLARRRFPWREVALAANRRFADAAAARAWLQGVIDAISPSPRGRGDRI